MQSEIQKRIKRLEGQLKGLDRMVEKKHKCLEILNQIAAIRSALDSLGAVILAQEASCLKMKKHDREKFQTLLKRFIKTKLT
jgi:DNA-binding FrmR family transcriptional regulator